MRVKPVPPPPTDLEAVTTAQRAVPLVPGSEADCCARLLTDLDLPSRDVARTWLTFLRGLGLVREGERGFVRVDVEPDRSTVAAGLRGGVFGVRELLDALSAGPLPEEAAAAAVLERVPSWERARYPDWEGRWRERAGHLLGWLVLVGLLEERPDGYGRS